MTTARVSFVGAGPGAPDLITVRGARAIGAADVVVWARSLVMEEVLAHARPDAEVIESTPLTLEDVLAVYERALRDDLVVARVHSGDPAIYGAIQEQIRFCADRGLPYEIVPGVSSVAAAAAALGRELTVPERSQSLILTRRGGRTPMPPGERVDALARHGTTMVLAPLRPAARAAGGRLSAGHAVRGGLPGELARRGRPPMPAGRARRPGSGGPHQPPGADPGRARARRRADQVPSLPPRLRAPLPEARRRRALPRARGGGQ